MKLWSIKIKREILPMVFTDLTSAENERRKCLMLGYFDAKIIAVKLTEIKTK